MKGLILSLAVFCLSAVFVIAICHFFRPTRHAKVFGVAILLGTPLYFGGYFCLPADLFFLPASWTTQASSIDGGYGFLVFLLNIHSFMDLFYGFNGGFSASIMLEIYSSANRSLTTKEIIQCYQRGNNNNTIFEWRLPRLVETGYLVVGPQAGDYRLTLKGLWTARIAKSCKRILNLGLGG